MSEGIHYRKGGKLTHCGCEILPNGKDIECIVIKNIEFKEKENVAGREEKQIWVANFYENPYTSLPMVLNATNRKRLSKLAKTPYINLIKDFPIRLTQEECRDIQDGGNTWGLRISKIPAKLPTGQTQQQPAKKAEKNVFTESHIVSAIEYLQTHTMEELEQFYEISPELKTKIENARKGN